MKKIILVIVGAALVGCSGQRAVKDRQKVVTEMQSTEVRQSPDHPCGWIVRTEDGSIWYVQTRFFNKMSTKSQIFPPRK